MALTPETTSMALFCDFENVALGVRDAKFDRFDIKRVLERLLLKGSIVVKKAYCDWDRYKPFKAAMHEANFELIEIPHVRQSGKNSADIRLVVDALDLCYTKSHVNTFVIISGDSDFSPLVSKLRENDKQVIGVGVKQSTSDLLIANCDEFIFYDDLVREGQRQAAKRSSTNPSEAAPAAAPKASPEEERNRREAAESRKGKAIDMAVETFEALVSERGDAGRIWPSMVKQALKRRKPDFSEAYFGFRTFGGLLEEAQGRGLLELGRDEKGNVFVLRSGSGGGDDSGHASGRRGSGSPQRSEPNGRRDERPDRGERGPRGGRSDRGARPDPVGRHDEDDRPVDPADHGDHGDHGDQAEHGDPGDRFRADARYHGQPHGEHVDRPADAERDETPPNDAGLNEGEPTTHLSPMAQVAADMDAHDASAPSSRSRSRGGRKTTNRAPVPASQTAAEPAHASRGEGRQERQRRARPERAPFYPDVPSTAAATAAAPPEQATRALDPEPTPMSPTVDTAPAVPDTHAPADAPAAKKSPRARRPRAPSKKAAA